MKKTAVSLALMGLLALGGQAVAMICTIDAVPAATLLLPYFEVDLSNPNGLTTLFSVNNASEEAALVHVVVWSDLSVPVLDFDIFLTGYDVQTVNMRDIIINGVVPVTADKGDDPGNPGEGSPKGAGISPEGAFSDDPVIPSCAGHLPPPALPAIYTAHLQAALTGHASALLGGLCAGQNLGDNIARGYITMDSVSVCSIDFPNAAGYFVSGGTGVANDNNILWGDWFIVNAAQNFAEGGDLVHIEADPTNPETTTNGNYTFWGANDTVPFSAADNREPLADTWATRFLNGGAFNSGTSLLVWRDAKQVVSPFTCPATTGRPIWYPLSQQAIVIFDEQETPSVPATFPFSPQPPGQSILPFPAQTQRTVVGGASFPVPFNFGWLYLDLKTAVTGALTEPPNDTANDIIAGNHISTQSFVIATFASNGHFAVGVDAIQLDSACATATLGSIVPFVLTGTNGPFDYIPSSVEPPGDTDENVGFP